MATWSGIRHKLENEYLAESLRGHIQYYVTTYSRSPDHEGRASIRLDGEEILSGNYYNQWSKAHLYPHDEKYERRMQEEHPFMDDVAMELGLFDQRSFYRAFDEFDNQSIEESLTSENLLVKIFALLDRRVGKRRLFKMKSEMSEEAAAIQLFYAIRIKAEGISRSIGDGNSIKWLFFDVGSTLIDETEAYNHRIRDAIEGTDITFEQFQEKRIYFAKQNLKGDLEAIKYFGLGKTPWHKEDETPYPTAEDTLKYLHDKGYKIGIIANQSLGTKERLEKWGLLKYISVVAASAELGVSKPDSRIFEIAFEMAGCKADEAVMIGDRLDNDIYPAKKIGMKTIWVKQGFAIYQKPINSEYEADYVVNDLSELVALF